jgi:hypothetical protein
MSVPGIGKYFANPLDWCRKLTDVVNGILQGRTNNYGTVTLTANAATTTITFAQGRLSQNTTFLIFAKTANAAADMGSATSVYESSRSVVNNTLTLTHPNNANADKTFGYALIG